MQQLAAVGAGPGCCFYTKEEDRSLWEGGYEQLMPKRATPPVLYTGEGARKSPQTTAPDC